MSTTQVTALLFQLQQLDLEADRLTAEQQAITASLQGDTKLRRLRLEAELAQKQLQSGLQDQKEAEWTLEDLERRLKEQDQRLYNGLVSSAKELQAIQQETQRLRAQQSRQEDILLQMIETAESLAEAKEKKSTQLEQAESEWKQEQVALEAKCNELSTQQKELQAKREQKVAGLTEDLLKRYESMRKTKQGRAVSKVEQNACQWCRVILTPSELQHVRMSVEIQTCTNCGRILYYDR